MARSHVRTVMPKVLDLVARGRLRPELVTTQVASFDEAPAAIGEFLRDAGHQDRPDPHALTDA